MSDQGRLEEIGRRVSEVRGRLAKAARRVGRDPAAITLVAVTKGKPLSDALAAYQAGVRDFGENRVQEAEAKYGSLPLGAVRHLIGPIQSNKANRAARVADVVQTIDSPEIARRLARAVAEGGGARVLDVFIEVNVAGEGTKAGVASQELPALIDAVREHANLRLKGLMTIPPRGESRQPFAMLRDLAMRHGLPGLSMGMSEDFEVAVEEGATLVRVGTAIFGARG